MGEGRGEGSFRALTQLLGNAANPQHRYDDGVQVLDHIVVAKAEDSIAGVLDVLLTLAIVIRAPDMAVAVELDHQLMVQTDEVDNVRPDRVLPPHLARRERPRPPLFPRRASLRDRGLRSKT